MRVAVMDLLSDSRCALHTASGSLAAFFQSSFPLKFFLSAVVLTWSKVRERVERLVETMDRNAKRHEARVGEAYTRLEQRADSSLVFWLSRTWVFLVILVAVAFMGAALFPPGAGVHRVGVGRGVELVGWVSLFFGMGVTAHHTRIYTYAMAERFEDDLR